MEARPRLDQVQLNHLETAVSEPRKKGAQGAGSIRSIRAPRGDPPAVSDPNGPSAGSFSPSRSISRKPAASFITAWEDPPAFSQQSDLQRAKPRRGERGSRAAGAKAEVRRTSQKARAGPGHEGSSEPRAPAALPVRLRQQRGPLLLRTAFSEYIFVLPGNEPKIFSCHRAEAPGLCATSCP